MAASVVEIQWKDEKLNAALAELRECPGGREVIDDIGIEYLVATFLAANDFDVEAVVELLRTTTAWRQSNGAAAARTQLLASGLSACPHMEEIRKYMPMCEGGNAIDKRGLPYAIRCLGLVDLEGLFASLSDDDIMEWQIYVVESRLLSLEAYAQRTGCLGDITLVQDTFAPRGLLAVWKKNREKSSIMQRFAPILDTHYPGVLGAVLLVNAPWVAHAILRVLRPLLPARLVKRVELVPSHLASERLATLIDRSAFPCFLGGEGPDDDFVPKRGAFLAAATPSDGQWQGSDQLCVKAGSTDERRLSLEKGAVVGFGFRVDGEGQDIIFGCYFEQADGREGQEIRSKSRVVEDCMGGNNCFSAPARGTFVMVFDNSYSWLKAKRIFFDMATIEVGSKDESASDKAVTMTDY